MLPLASIFSGSEVFLLASDVLVKKLNRGLGVESRYGCEWKRPKRDFILKVIHNMPLGNKACLFHNAEAMSGAVAPCAAHGKDCWIPDGAKGPVAGAFGFSCKDFSSANNNPPQKKVMIQKGLGSSGKTARSLIDFLAMHPLPIVWLENVGELCSESHGQLHVLKELLANAGYIAKETILNSLQFALPQDRRRAYLICFHEHLIEPPEGKSHEDMLNEAIQVLDRMKTAEIYDYKKFLVGDGDPDLSAEFKKRTKAAGQSQKPTSASWQGKHFEFFQEQGLSASACEPSAEVLQSEWFKLLPPREKQVLGYWANKAPDAFGVDVSQSINRTPLCKRAHMPSLMPTGHYFLFEAPFIRPLLGKECMHMQGFPPCST